MREIAEIFAVFFKIGAVTFGGGYTVLPLMQKDIALDRKWASNEEIIDYYAISQSMPGIICVNMSMLIGYRRKKIPGLLAAGLGVSVPSLIIILMAAMFLKNFLYLDSVQHAFNGIKVAVAVLICEAVLNMWKSGVKDWAGRLIFAVTLAIFACVEISPAYTVVAGALAGILIMRRSA
ncbi:MAG: chromate transporter [Synergistaceae bacterium]|jgi:chromate transporter|nr:chromate transporter [Synergistaceae bacterium]